MGLVHFKILIFSDFSSMGVGLEKESQNFVIHSKLQIFYAFGPKLSALRKIL